MLLRCRLFGHNWEWARIVGKVYASDRSDPVTVFTVPEQFEVDADAVRCRRPRCKATHPLDSARVKDRRSVRSSDETA